MHREQLTIWLMERLKTGQNILYPLNLMLFTDFRKWSFIQLREFIKVSKSIVIPNMETSFILITYNPIMSLGLMIQFLKQIRTYFNVFDVECNMIMRKLELMGKMIIETMLFDNVEAIFLETDFSERSTLNIITDNNIMSFIVINKLKFLLDKIWDGKDSSLIDGKTSHFSRTEYLLYHEIKHLKGVKVTLKDIVGDSFKANIEDYNFIYQKKFRQQSIMIMLVKDFICATFLALTF